MIVPQGRRGDKCPCNSDFRDSDRLRVAVTGGCPKRPGSLKTVGELGAPPVSPSSPNSRLGRKARSPIRQGWVTMDFIAVGIDVSKDHLDVAVRPSGEAFTVERNAAGVEQLAERLGTLSPHVVALEATGGFETVAASNACGGGTSGRHRQSGPGAGLCQGDRAACQDRSDRCRRHRPLRRGDQAAGAAAARRSDAAVGRSGRPPAADRRDDRRRTPAREAPDSSRICARASRVC